MKSLSWCFVLQRLPRAFVEAPSDRVEILSRKRRDRPFDNVSWHWLLHHGSNLLEALMHALFAGRVREKATEL